MSRIRRRAVVLLPLVLVLSASVAAAQTHITSPKEEFGHNIGDDYFLANYTQLVAYWQKLAAESDRMLLDTIGPTAEGRPQLMAIVSSPENLRNLEHYKQISQRLAHAEGLTDEEAHRLAQEGKAIVWIDGGLHATEVLGAHQLMETVYQMVSRDDPETLRFLNDDIILFVQANPDGMELVSNWYMRNPDPEERSTSNIPRLYQKYTGHDNNRDFYMSTQPETENMNRIMFREWFPQIVYNHHQTGPAGTVMFSPPFRDPFNYNFDPLILTGLEMVGGAMHDRFLREGKPGVTTRSGANYSTWWDGGLRTETYFHNMIGLLTETIGNPTPIDIPFIPSKQLPRSDLPMPIPPTQTWHFRQSIEYEITANRAVLDVASRRSDLLLYNMYTMANRQIERGSKDTWLNTPRRIAAAEAALEQGNDRSQDDSDFGRDGGVRGTEADFERLLRDPAMREARGYIIPSDQPDFLTATKFVETLLENGVEVERATAPFTVAGKQYAAGSFVVKTAQAFAPHVYDMFEPQDHPDDIPYPGGPPTPPYDNAGWTLAYQMDVQFDRILDGFDGPFERIEGAKAPLPKGGIVGEGTTGYFLSHKVNDAFIAVNRLLAQKKDVYWLKAAVQANGRTYPTGTFYIPGSGSVRSILEKLGTDKGLTFEATNAKPKAPALKLRPTRIALWDQYGGSQPSGWTRWIFEQFEFPFDVVYPQELDAGNLADKYDVIVFVDGAIPAQESNGRGRRFGREPDSASIPAEFRDRLGSVTIEKTVPQLRAFLEAGGTVLTIGSSTNLAEDLGLPVADALVENGEHLPRSKYYVPGSILQAAVDTSLAITRGIDPRVDFFFDNSPVFTLTNGTGAQVQRIAWFDNPHPLRSGWAWGQEHLDGAVAAARATVGEGTLYLFGPEIAFRAQPHGTFKFLFNGVYLNEAQETQLK